MSHRHPVNGGTMVAALVVAAAAIAVRGFIPVALGAQTSNPDSARIVTRDISNFWRAIDAAHGRDTAALIASVRAVYLRDPSPGLFDWILNRLIDQSAVGRALEVKGWDRARMTRAMDAPTGSAERAAFDSIAMPVILDNAAANVAATYRAQARYYDGIRQNTLAVDTAQAIKDSIHAAFRRLTALYPEAQYRDVYFLIGRLTSGGTVGPSGMLIGTEMNGRDASTPTGELTPWLRAVTGQVDDLPHIVAHEMIHTLQTKRDGPRTLLSASLDEGSADFISELISGRRIRNPAYAFGEAHEHELWTAFAAAKDSAKTSDWLFQGDRTPPGRPADLGYWMGYRITKAYYERSLDKHAAIREILLYKDPDALLAASGYGR